MMDVRDWSLRYYLPRTPHPWITCFVLVLSIYLVISLYLTYDVIPVENVVVRSRIPGALTYDDVTETSKHAIKVGGDSTTRASFTFEGDPAVTDGSRLLPEISQRASKDFDVIEPSPINGVLGSQFVIAQASKFDTPLGDGTEKKAGFSEKSKLDPESFSLQVTSDMIDNFQVSVSFFVAKDSDVARYPVEDYLDSWLFEMLGFVPDLKGCFRSTVGSAPSERLQEGGGFG
ncbi:hypothetical protein LSH36_406g02081 [Paralvinella palmiformis]|uniref:Uncharacterized protein n=1 Tax=Paralvinella palmiformis TaxID=53620 RepID=A0AAD9MZZ8_9ANNE|nr:hypothetical protein LSH36_406g02081 [Paralvinella palmiformis]